MAPSDPDSSPQVSPTQQSSDDARTDLSAAVDDLLNSLSNKFASMSSEIFAKMDEMTRRLDNLEAKLMAGMDASQPS